MADAPLFGSHSMRVALRTSDVKVGRAVGVVGPTCYSGTPLIRTLSRQVVLSEAFSQKRIATYSKLRDVHNDASHRRTNEKHGYSRYE